MVKRPDFGVGTTIATALAIAMALGFSLRQVLNEALPYFGLERPNFIVPVAVQVPRGFVDRVSVLVNVLDQTPDAEKPKVVASAQRPNFRAQVVRTPMQMPDAGKLGLSNMIRNRIVGLVEHPKLISVAPGFEIGDSTGELAVVRAENAITVEVPLAGGQWLVASGKAGRAKLGADGDELLRLSLFAWIALSALLVAALSFMVTRRVVAPLSKLAAAVEQLGVRGGAVPLHPEGPREVRLVIESFRRMQERLRRYDEDRTRMIGAMSHDLRTPLTRLRFRLEVMESLPDQPKVLSEIDTMNDVIESILAFARDDSSLEPKSLMDLSSLLEGVCEDMADAGEPVTFSGPRQVAVSGRPSALRRAFANVIENAVKYGKSATVSLISEPSKIIVTIEDEGPGIPRHERERVFEPFYRRDPSRSLDAERGGVGLGLAVTRSVIWEHGGEIDLHSRKGRGLIVRVELPTGMQEYS